MNRKSGKSSSDESKRRVRRMSEDESVSYKQKREAGREPRPEAEGDRPGRRPEREERPNNLHLYISPRLLDLAAELADEAGMPVRLFLCELIKNGLLAQAGNTGKSRYTAEFVSENKRRISYWRPESGEPSEFEQGDEDQFSDRRRSGHGRQGRFEGGGGYGDRGGASQGGGGYGDRGGAGRGRAGSGQGGAGRGRSSSGQGGAGRGRAGSGQGGAGRGRASSGQGGAGRGRASSGEGGKTGGYGKKTGGGFGKARAGGGGGYGGKKRTGGSGGQGRGGSKPGRKTSRGGH